jgi:CheY-like chemotaxis protein
MRRKVKKKILLVEDNEVLREAIKKFLELRGYEVMTAGDGLEAIVILRRQHFDLIITDFMMPKLNGLELIHWIKRKRCDIKIILLSGEDMKLVYPAAKRAGADKIIPKNFDLKLRYIFNAAEELLAGK